MSENSENMVTEIAKLKAEVVDLKIELSQRKGDLKVLTSMIADYDRNAVKGAMEKLFEHSGWIVEALPIAVFILNDSGEIVTLNNAATQITGHTENGLAGRDIRELLYEDPKPAFLEDLARRGQYVQATIRKRSGDLFSACIRVQMHKSGQNILFCLIDLGNHWSFQH